MPIIIVATAFVGLLLGLPSRRLLGDYLAIVTLFFGLAFVTFTTNGNRLTLLGHSRAVDLTSGPNGISGLDPLTFFGKQVNSIQGYFYVALITLAVVMIGLHLVVESRTGRAWKALREDPLAAEAMSIPVNRLKLLAFAFGAGVAGLTGVISAAVDGAVFPDSYDIPLLITIYAMVILGGAGSLSGVVLGAITINVSLEVLRDPNQARWLFYSAILITLVAKMRPWKKLAAVLVSLVAFGYAVHAIVAAVWPAGTEGAAAGGDAIGRAVQGWVIRPEHNATLIGNYAYVALIAAVLVLTLLEGVLAHRLPRAHALPRGVRVGERARPPAERDAPDHPRRAPDRADERAAAGSARHGASGDRMSTPLLELRNLSKAFGGLTVIDELDLEVARGRDRQRDRAERRREDDAVQPDHRPLPSRLGRRAVRGSQHPRPRPAHDREARDRAHVPDASPVPEHDACRRT